MPCEAPVITATFRSLLMLVSFILPGHGYAGGWSQCGHFHSNAAAGEDDFQLSVGAMSDRQLCPRRGQQPAPAYARRKLHPSRPPVSARKRIRRARLRSSLGDAVQRRAFGNSSPDLLAVMSTTASRSDSKGQNVVVVNEAALHRISSSVEPIISTRP